MKGTVLSGVPLGARNLTSYRLGQEEPHSLSHYSNIIELRFGPGFRTAVSPRHSAERLYDKYSNLSGRHCRRLEPTVAARIP